MHDESTLARLFPTPAAIDALGDNAAEEMFQLSKGYAPVQIALAQAEELTAHFALARSAAAKFATTGYPNLTTEERQALHAFVHLVTRPSLQIRDGEVRGIPRSWELLASSRAVVESFLPGVGRIDRVDDGVRVRVATGWFVKEGLLMTNNHVAAGLCGIDAHTNPHWREDLGAAIGQFNDLWASDETSRPTWDPADAPGTDVAAAAGRIVHADLHPTLDMAVLRVEGVEDSESRVIALSTAGPADEEQRVYTLGYPAVEVNGLLHPALVDFLFGATESGMTKRVAPGQLRAVGASPVEHDVTTLGGSSGSPVIDFKSQLAVGLHFSGQYGVVNRAVPLWLHQTDPFFTKHGVTFV